MLPIPRAVSWSAAALVAWAGAACTAADHAEADAQAERLAAYPLVDDDGFMMPSHPDLLTDVADVADVAAHRDGIGLASARQADRFAATGHASLFDPLRAAALLDAAGVSRDAGVLIDATDRAAALAVARRLRAAGHTRVWLYDPTA